MDPSPGPARIPERDALLAAVDEIEPILAAHADAAEEARTLSPPAVDALTEAGIFSMASPRSLGGLEADPLTQMEVIERIAKIDASTAWCAFIGAGGAGLVGGYAEDSAVEQIAKSAGSRGWPRFAGAGVPSGRAFAVEGGYRVSGRWGWASGIPHADWVYGNAILERDGEPVAGEYGMPQARLMVMPADQVVVEDTWHAAGLKGTGSTHFHVKDVFVPQEFAIPFPGAPPQRGGALFQLPVLGFLGPAFSGFPQGVAQRALAEIQEVAKSKVRIGTTEPLTRRGVFQRDFALAHGRLRAARLLVRESLEQIWEHLHRHGGLSEDVAAPMMFSFSHAALVASEVTEFAYRYGGASALYSSSPLQRCFRDMTAGAQHILVGENNFEYAGQVLLGVASPNPLFTRSRPDA